MVVAVVVGVIMAVVRIAVLDEVRVFKVDVMDRVIVARVVLTGTTFLACVTVEEMIVDVTMVERITFFPLY